MNSPPIPDDLLLDIFRRIHDAADLVRTCAACVSFRRIIADRSFLRQYRKIHAPPLLGFLDARKDFQPAEPPYPTAPLGADFSFSFLPPPASDWVLEDVRDGRVLLGRSYIKVRSTVELMELLVCDPLHRQYLLLPPIPKEIYREIWMPRHTFLVPPSGSGDKEEAAAFRVIWMARRGDKLAALVFSSSTGQWQAGPSHSWSNSFTDLLSLPVAVGEDYLTGFSLLFRWFNGDTLVPRAYRRLLLSGRQDIRDEMVCASKWNHSMFWPRVYTNFPPALLSSPTVPSGAEPGTENETVEHGGAAAQVHNRHGDITADVSAGAWKSG